MDRVPSIGNDRRWYPCPHKGRSPVSMPVKITLLLLGIFGGLAVGVRRGVEEYSLCLNAPMADGGTAGAWLCGLRAAQYFIGTPIFTTLLMLGLILVIDQRRRG